jgi:hypothetical protein
VYFPVYSFFQSRSSSVSVPLYLPGSQKVIIGGKYECFVIPLHSTVSQIACKTSSALDGSWELGDWGDGWTDRLDVVVIVDGRQSTCETKDKHGCTYQFRNTGWWDHIYTPKVLRSHSINKAKPIWSRSISFGF